MDLFDRLGSGVTARRSAVGVRTERFTFAALPSSLAEMRALPEADLNNPFKTAALTVCALCAYAADRVIGTEMLNWLRGPRPLTGQELSLLNSRLRGRDRVPFSFFAGAVPENGCTPSQPYTVSVCSDHNSGAEPGYMELFIPSGGSDAARPVSLRMGADGRWFLWEQYLLPDVAPAVMS